MANKIKANKPSVTGVGPEAMVDKVKVAANDLIASIKEATKSIKDADPMDVDKAQALFNATRNLQNEILPALTTQCKTLRNDASKLLVTSRQNKPKSNVAAETASKSSVPNLQENQIFLIEGRPYSIVNGKLVPLEVVEATPDEGEEGELEDGDEIAETETNQPIT